MHTYLEPTQKKNLLLFRKETFSTYFLRLYSLKTCLHHTRGRWRRERTNGELIYILRFGGVNLSWSREFE